MGDDGKNSTPVPGQLTPAELFEQEQAALLLDLGITSEYGVGRFSYCEVVPPKRARAADCWVEQLDYSLPLNKQPHHSAMLVVADLKRPEWDPEASKQDENWCGIVGKMAGAAAEGTMSAFSDLADTVQDYQDRDGHIEHVAGTIYPKKGDVEGDGSDHAGSLSDDTTPNEDEKTKKRRNPLKRISKKLASATTTSARSALALRPRVPGGASGEGSAGEPSLEEGEEEEGQESESSGASLSDHDQTPHANWKRHYQFDAVVGAETKRKSDAVSATSSVAPSEVGSRSGTKNNSKLMKGALVPGDGGYGDATPAASSKPEQRPTVDLPHFHGTSNLGRSRENRNAQVERLRRQLERQKDALRAKYKAQKAENKGPVAGEEAGRGQKAMAGTAPAAGPAKAKAATGSGNQTQGNEKPALGSSSRAAGSVDDIPKRGADGAATPPPRVTQADGAAIPPPRVSQPAKPPARLVKRASGVNQRDGATAVPAKEQTTTTGGKPKSVQEDPAAKQEAAAAAPKNPVVTVKKAAATNKREGATSAPTAANKTGPPPAASPKAPVPDKLKQAVRGSAGAEAKPAQKADGGAPDAGKVVDDAKPKAAKTSVPAAAAVASPKPSAGVALATEGSTELFYPATAVTSVAATPGATPGAIPKPVAATSTKKTTEEPGAKVAGAEAGAAVMSPSPKPVAGAAEKPSEAKPAKEETASTSTKTAEPFAKAAGPVPVAATPPGAAVQSVAPIQKTVADSAAVRESRGAKNESRRAKNESRGPNHAHTCAAKPETSHGHNSISKADQSTDNAGVRKSRGAKNESGGPIRAQTCVTGSEASGFDDTVEDGKGSHFAGVHKDRGAKNKSRHQPRRAESCVAKPEAKTGRGSSYNNTVKAGQSSDDFGVIKSRGTEGESSGGTGPRREDPKR
eukprot:g4068.t1